MGAVSATTRDLDLEAICGRHHRAWIDTHRARFQARPVVQGIDRIARKGVEQAVFQHGARAAAAFLRGLEDQHGGAIEVARLRQVLCRADQDRRVSVMAATVHQARLSGLVPELVVFSHWQGIHVGAQADHASTVATLAANHADHAGLADATMHFDAQRFQRASHDARGAHLLESQLGMGVQIAPQRRQFVMKSRIDSRGDLAYIGGYTMMW